MAREHKAADKLSYDALSQIQEYLIGLSGEQAPLTMSDVWRDMGKAFGLTKQQFINTLSANLKLRRLGGFELKDDNIVLKDLTRAKSALVQLQNPPDQEAAKEDKEYRWSTRRPVTTLGKRTTLWIKDDCYKIPMAPRMVTNLLVNVLLAKESEDGMVVYGGKRYNCDDALLYRYLTGFLGLSYTVSEPELRTHDENGIPLALLE